KDPYNTYRTPAVEEGVDVPSYVANAKGTSTVVDGSLAVAPAAEHLPVPAADSQEAPLPAAAWRAEGQPRPLLNPHAFYESERKRTYRSLPFWKRCVILLAGPGMNILFTLIAFVVIYSVVGYDIQNTETGEITHIVVDPIRSIQAGFNYIGMVFVAILGLFNPQTAAATVSDSTSLISIAVLSKSAVEQGIISAIMFSAMLSVSLGLMNLLPIPPLDGGRFVVEIVQKIRGKALSPRVMNSLSLAGVALFMLFFIFMVNQDIQRFVFGNW
ncbi:MAG: site-2 protease family protein, partial [Eggerthellaceae bacterium]|nr:site-2 protease family protein [Eggerthellaceae bacterium]